jgi:CCR4-NOT transcription complex subunit 9
MSNQQQQPIYKVLKQEQRIDNTLNHLVQDLLDSTKREETLIELSKKRESYPNLAPVLWYATGVMAVLLQEVVNVYSLLSPPQLSALASNRVCNALALLQSIAAHPDTRPLFLNAHIPLFLYPFLNTITKQRPFEFLRLTSLGVIGALVKSDDHEVIKFLLSTEIVPICLRIMETGTELSKTVATFIVQKIILVDTGLNYFCATSERFFAVSSVLANMVKDSPSGRLLKHIIRCYLRLSDHPRARDALKGFLPEQLRDNTFDALANEDPTMKKWLQELRNVVPRSTSTNQGFSPN